MAVAMWAKSNYFKEMKFEVSIPFQAQITYEDGCFEVVGPRTLLEKLMQLKKDFGNDIQNWPTIVQAKLPQDVLINELISQVKKIPFVYNHDELCHCRMVPTEKVKNAVKSGCHSVSEVSRTTLAGTGCGSCRPDIENIIHFLTETKPTENKG